MMTENILYSKLKSQKANMYSIQIRKYTTINMETGVIKIIHFFILNSMRITMINIDCKCLNEICTI